MLKPHQPAYALGVDVSHYDGPVNWQQVLKAGYGYGIAKATEGPVIVDPLFAQNWDRMGSAGITRERSLPTIPCG